MIEGFKPMLASVYADTVTQPAFSFVSEKLDGVRCIFIDGVAYSRRLIPFPNTMLQKVAQDYPLLDRMDCEIIVGDKYHKGVLQSSVGFCIGFESKQEFTIYVFDIVNSGKFNQRAMQLKELFSNRLNELPLFAKYVEHFIVSPKDLAEVSLEQYAEDIVNKGGEGVMVNDGDALYNYGRSTTKYSPPLQKLKKFKDLDATVVGFEQMFSNNNPSKRDNLGNTLRSTVKSGMVPVEMLGSIRVEALGSEFSVGSGWTNEERKKLWNDRENLVGRVAKVKYFTLGKNGTPRFPTFIGWRSTIDT